MMINTATIEEMSQVTRLPLHAPLNEFDAIPASARQMLQREGFETAADLLYLFPVRHEDRRHMTFTSFTPDVNPVCHHVLIRSTRLLRFGRNAIFEALVVPDDNAAFHHQLTLRWFGMPFLQKALAAGMELIIYGKIKEVKTRLIMDHPEYEVITEEDAAPGAPRIHTGRIVPVYRLKAGLKQKPLRAALWQVWQHLDANSFQDLLPTPSARGEFAGLNRYTTLRTLHDPQSMEELSLARRYLALEEFYLLQLRLLRHRNKHREQGGIRQPGDNHLVQAFLDELPFELTEPQKRCLHEIREDMSDARPMNRLLHGDVGSGKTVVALAAMLAAVESGHQAALMAPTQILAEQHYQNACRWLTPLGIRVALKTADKKIGVRSKNEEPVWYEDEDRSQKDGGLLHVLIGTHALLYDHDSLPKLGLAVIDEQHKFGVAQRSRLIANGQAKPDVLVMTATPIPRTLTLTLYGDLDVSTIDQRPKERGKVITAIREENKLKDITAFLKKELDDGRQCYVVHPLIEESEKLDASAAITGYEAWGKRLKKHTVGLLHGRMAAEEKEDVMRRFREGSIQALVSTSVIEVGVDVPNATVMIIHDAARFGLAQLHQLRGRIGRGTHNSYCILLIDKGDEEARARLAIMEQTHDGFVIAEEDLKRRGPGDVLGSMQSGAAPLRFHEQLADTRLLTLARQLATRTLDRDPELRLPANERLRDYVKSESIVATALQ